MTKRLAVVAYDLGASFIDKHLADLSKGAVAVGSLGAVDAGNLWTPACPMLLLDRWAAGLPARLGRRIGLSSPRMQDAVVSRFLRKHRTEVVLGEYLDQFLPFVPLLKRLGLPYVIQGHGIDVSAALRRSGAAEDYLVYGSATAILTRSEFHRQRLISIGLPAEKVHVNRGGVDVPPSAPVRTSAAAKRFLGVGRMVPKKAPIYLLEAFRRAAARDRELTLDYIGGGPLYPAARQFVDACDLQDKVRLHGVAPEETKERLFQECGVFVQHSMTNPETGDEEGLPAAIQEAMAHGMAVVSTRHAGIPEAVIEGVTGLLGDEGDVDAMAENFVRVPALAAEMGLAGHREARAKHAWEHEKARLRQWLFEAA